MVFHLVDSMRRLREFRVNETRSYSLDYPAQYSDIVNDPFKMSTLRNIFADDIAFYERWAGRP